MIKNLIFDLDNTIIKDEKEDALYYKDVLKKLGYDENDYWDIYMSIDRYQSSLNDENYYYDRKEMLNFINKDLDKNYSLELVDGLIDVVGKYWAKRILLEKNIVKKLSEKYNLYVYTNYFQEAQANRIKCIGYENYFIKVFGADVYGAKPFRKSFEKVLNEIDAKPEECIMIGDDKSMDVLAANAIGMKSILFDYNEKRDKVEIKAENYMVIKDLKELLDIL